MRRLRRGTCVMIRYVIGDATAPRGPGLKIIAHVCNDAGGWGAGFTGAISQRWPQPEEAYRHAFRRGTALLGTVDLVPVDLNVDISVANMVAQRGWGSGSRRVDYEALRRCLDFLRRLIARRGLVASIHMPRIGTGLGGGSWEDVGPLVEECLRELDVTVYDLPERH